MSKEKKAKKTKKLKKLIRKTAKLGADIVKAILVKLILDFLKHMFF
jgi:hypothetical protein